MPLQEVISLRFVLFYEYTLLSSNEQRPICLTRCKYCDMHALISHVMYCMHVDAAAKADLEMLKQESIAKGMVYYNMLIIRKSTSLHT